MVAVNIVIKIDDVVFWSYVEFSEHENLPHWSQWGKKKSIKFDFEEWFFFFYKL